ncbi:MAG: gliding motility protein GldL [Chitinophagaceae bacterium]|jgi:gliding motility-associated protein GldL|nr:MAG: gliding motility protein GldL [Chitinophagaceae bacterium]
MAFSLKTKKARAVLNVIFSVGAAVVIFGALAKIEHWGGAMGRALEVGMLCETFVFILMAFQPAEENYYWERFFPDINVSPEEEEKRTGAFKPTYLNVPANGHPSNPALTGMDKMLQEADVTPANLKRLSDNFQRLGTTVEKMSDVADVVSATGEYTQHTKEASAALVKMREVYSNAASAVASFNNSAQSTHEFHSQIQQMTKNLASLNAMYELELQDTNNHLKAMNHFYSNLTTASQSMAASIEDSKKTQEQVALLAKNLSNLNAVYGNMLSAMQGSRR